MGRVSCCRCIYVTYWTACHYTTTHTERKKRVVDDVVVVALDEKRSPGDESGCHIANFRTLDEGGDRQRISQYAQDDDDDRHHSGKLAQCRR